MKLSAAARKPRREPIPSVILDSDDGPVDRDRLHRIATAAYYKAEARGFVPGQEMDDWLEAEAEIQEAEGR